MRAIALDAGAGLSAENSPQGREGSGAASLTSNLMDALTREMRTLAALEAAVYLARGSALPSRAPEAELHTPARRLARSVVTFGAEDGLVFGLRAVRAVEAAADGCGVDLQGMVYWLCNVIQLRWMLWAMCGGADGGGDSHSLLGDFAGIMQSLGPPLRDLECHLFEQLTKHLWFKVLLPTATQDLDGAGLNQRQKQEQQQAGGNGVEQRYEAATQRWVFGLDAALALLKPPVPLGRGVKGGIGAASEAAAGHMRLLRQKVVGHLLRRIDTAVYQAVISESAPGTGSGANGLSEQHPLPEGLLPFSRGKLSFGCGMHLKMAVSRMTHWAADARVEEGLPWDQYSFFPRLRAAADLLMLPKNFVLEPRMRAEVLPGLAVHDMLRLLRRFVTDDFSPDPVPRGVLDRLKKECGSTPAAPPQPPPRYSPLAESRLLAEGLIEPVSLEMDDDSDDELEGLAHMYEQSGDSIFRFELLREMWASAR